eukprot:Seg3447.3 transcript_id=Seg3447.3/GoldUCD/mRNA.D3Y31 product="hypothetical protein" protein_id=Seg3447.3/GoldUCD/D3Y31
MCIRLSSAADFFDSVVFVLCLLNLFDSNVVYEEFFRSSSYASLAPNNVNEEIDATATMNNNGLRDFLAFITIVALVLTIFGAIMMLKFSLHGITPGNSIVKYIVRYLSISNLLVGIVAMPLNTYVQMCQGELSCNVACLSRYFFTFIFSTDSLIILATLCHFKRDLIVKVPFGKTACVTSANKGRLIVIYKIISFVPNVILAGGYLYLMLTDNTPPCRPDEKHKKTTHYYLGMAEGVKTGILFSVCFTVIIKDVSKIRKTLADQASRVGKSSVRGLQTAKVTANIYFAVVFIVMWIPFSGIAAFASYIPPVYYEEAITVGYTLAYTSFALLPICYALTDGNFKTYVRGTFALNKVWPPVILASARSNVVMPLDTVQAKR